MKSWVVMGAACCFRARTAPSASGPHPYRAALAAAALLAAPAPARRAPPPAQIILDAANPVIAAELNGVPFRLRVDLNQWDSVELNPDAAARLTGPWAAGRDLAVGRVTLWGRTLESRLVIAGVKRPVLVAQHGRLVAEGADGAIGPDLLPYATVLWRRAGAPAETGSLVLPLALDDYTGISSPAPALGPDIAIRFTLDAPRSSGTAAAGAILARRFGGSYAGPSEPVAVTHGVTRPARPIAFARTPVVAGFRFPSLLVRISDFRGDNALPDEALPDADITVAHRERPQAGVPWITVAADRLSRCAEITYTARPRTLRLSCAFEPE